MKILYLCDRKKDCADVEHCNVCHHTFDEKHALRGIPKDKDELIERFILIDDVWYEAVGICEECAYLLNPDVYYPCNQCCENKISMFERRSE